MCIKEMTIQEIQKQLGYKIKIIENKPQKLLFEDYSAYELASVFYPEIVKSLFL